MSTWDSWKEASFGGGDHSSSVVDPLGLFAEGGMFGPSGDGGLDLTAQNDFIKKLTDQLAQLDPLRTQMLGQFGDVMSGKFDPTTSPMYANIFSSAKQATEDQYNMARENVLGGTARGGAQTGALADVEMARAGQMGSLPAQISQGLIQDMMGKAYGSVFPQGKDTEGTAMSGFNNMSNMQMQQLLLQQQQDNSNMQGIGSLLALFAG